MRILITGATGFIGSNLVKLLLTTENELFCTLMANERNPFEEKDVKPLFFSKNDMQENIIFMKENKIDGIVHLASFVQSGDHSPDDIINLINSNIKFGTQLLEVAASAKVKWFINTATYWQHYNGEDYSPVNLYAATKQAFLDIAKYYWEAKKIWFNTLLLYDTYGPNDTRSKVFNLWNRIAKTQEILDMSPGEQKIDISHIDDITAAYKLLIKCIEEGKQVYNGDVYTVNCKCRYSLKELASIFESINNCKLNINWGGKSYKEREIMFPWNQGNNVPGWKPSISIADGIKTII
jgi:CDP-paratose synthetase